LIVQRFLFRSALLPRPLLRAAWSVEAAASETVACAPLPVVAFGPAMDAPRLRVVAENVEPIVRVQVRTAPLTDASYARVAVLRPGIGGSVVWYQSTMRGADETPDLALIGQKLTAWRDTGAGGAHHQHWVRP
jgi:hypothetical protein